MQHWKVFLIFFIFIFNSCKKAKLETLNIGGDFTLVSHENPTWNFKQHAKKVNLIFFGYTSCPDYCPTTLSKFKSLNYSLGDVAKDVQYVFISVDPKRDKPEVLKKYVDFYIPNGVGLTGTPEQIDEVVQKYKANYEVNGDFIDHSTYVYLVDQNLQTRYLFKHKDTIDYMKQIISYVLAE